MTSLQDIWEEYLRHHSKPRGNEATDTRAMRWPLEAFSGASAFPPAAIQDYAQRRQEGALGRPVKPSTVRRELTALQAVLNWGARHGHCEGRVCFEKPPDGPARDKWLTEDQQGELLAKLESAVEDVQIFLRLALTYGVRRGAIMDLRFSSSQICFETNTIDFNVPGARLTRKRRPVVPMTARIREDLFRTQACKAAPCNPGTPYEVQKFLKSAGFDWVTPHVCKHSAISQMLRAGASPLDVARFTATDLRTIERVYRHHTAGEFLKLAEARGI